jgi:hypothetical protein
MLSRLFIDQNGARQRWIIEPLADPLADPMLIELLADPVLIEPLAEPVLIQHPKGFFNDTLKVSTLGVTETLQGDNSLRSWLLIHKNAGMLMRRK